MCECKHDRSSTIVFVLPKPEKKAVVWVAGAYLLSRGVSKDGLMVVLIVDSINCWYDVVLRKYTRRGYDIWAFETQQQRGSE